MRQAGHKPEREEGSEVGMTQEEFMAHIIKEICDYAVDNSMGPDDTLLTIADNIIKLVSISTFNGWKKEVKR